MPSPLHVEMPATKTVTMTLTDYLAAAELSEASDSFYLTGLPGLIF